MIYAKSGSSSLKATKHRPILITGSHRSGSTWVGKMVAASREVGYLQEPFHPCHDPGLFQASIDLFNIYIQDHNAARYEAATRNLLKFRYSPLARMAGPRGLRDAGASILFAACHFRYRLERRRPLLKDPLALFSAEWLADRFNAQVVVLVRHPAAFANSLAKANWRYPFDNLLKQPRLMEDHLSGFRRDIEHMVRHGDDIVGEAILIWRITHHVIAGYQRRRPDWLIFRHEDLSRDPVRSFAPIFQYLGLDYGVRVQQFIDDCTRFGNPVERPSEQWPAFARLDSRRNVNRWAERLSPLDIARVKEGTADVWHHFYDESDWPAHAPLQRVRAG
jgi:Sulfotransferase family